MDVTNDSGRRALVVGLGSTVRQLVSGPHEDRRIVLRVSKMPVTSPLCLRWRARGKVARMKDMDFAHPGPAVPVRVHA